NDGFALPFAIEAAMLIALRTRDDDTIRVYSEALDSSHEWKHSELTETAHAPDTHWSNYLRGVVREFRERGTIVSGADVFLHGSVPIGMGVSSSAALTIGFAKGYALLCHEVFDTGELIDMCVAVERHAINIPSGTLDQTAILHAAGGHVMFVDFRTREITQIPLPRGDTRFLMIDTGESRQLAETGYARRRKECELAAAYFREVAPGVRSLRDVTADMVKRHASQVAPAVALRALHVATENERVLAGAMALKKCDWETFGRLMTAAHESLRDNFEASTATIDAQLSAVIALPGVLGARLTGGGFGGAIIALAKREALDDIKSKVGKIVAAQRGSSIDPESVSPRFQWVHPGDGVSILRA
ncbi:MAG: galactokinase, partial [Phycisphaerae bacterium]